ncbi:hypothetical protein F0Q45_08615 [Mycobacterium simiae]|uniref:Uncharacterized protein n=1 Tax=Mycobacterium simiae TaxID=1784 RepID=A0A5B1BTC5_MYCSI|nr:hypothetical protein [Mycobacterium simiae]KAA1250633.1 hypothetical protein F0Q45_08615 [Mycobacterium simiae]
MDSTTRPQAKGPGRANFIDTFLKSPFAGIAPWVLLSILSGPGRFAEATLAALGFSLLVMVVGRSRGIKIHALEIFSAVFFGALAVVGLLATAGVIQWLELWAGELTNIVLAGFAWLTLLIGKPFTIAYAKDTTSPEHWDSPLFKRINGVITAAWASAFTFAAGAGFVGDYVFRDAGNFWTGWILQLAAIFFAVSVTEFYPGYAAAKVDLANGQPAQLPSIVQIIQWLPKFLVVTAIVGFFTDSVDLIMGITLIVVGSLGAGIVTALSPSKPRNIAAD